jgi:hypothetical protein
MKKKKWLLIPLVVILIAVIWYVSSTQWTRDFDLRYVEYVSSLEAGNYSGGPHRIYEITNNTHRTLKDVSVVISVENFFGKIKYEDSVAHDIQPGETVEYKLYEKDWKKAVEEQGKQVGWDNSIEIVKIKYSK